MAILKCKMCGGDLNITEGMTVAECEYCGSMQTVPTVDNEKKLTLFARANRLRAGCEFDKAAGVYETIVADFPEEAEAYWGLVLCKYGIEYVDDPATGKKIPTCHRSSFNSVMEDNDFEQALENADMTARKVYREEAKQIEELRRGIIAVSANERPYDIFICYKETDENGERTLDSVLAQDIYDALTGKGYRVFFSRITLEDKLGVEYEPYIFAALNSAKVMLAVGTDYEYYNAVWVKNEWSRYLKLMEQDKSKHLIPCFKGIDAYDMPREFARLQAQDLGKVGAIQDLLRGVEKLLPREASAPVVQETVPANSGDSRKLASLLDRGNMALEDGDWEKADGFFEEVLNNDSKNAQAYLGKALAEEKCRTIDAFVRKRKDMSEDADGETLQLPPDKVYVTAALERFLLHGYVTEDSIRRLYQFDLSYHSEVKERQRQYQNEEKFWTEHKWLSRAQKFASGEFAEDLARQKKRLFTALTERLKKAQGDETAEITRVQEAYARHLKQADAQAEALYQKGVEQKQQYYQQLLQSANDSNDVNELTKTAQKFDALGDYQDGRKLAAHCRKRAAEERAKQDAEVQRKQKAARARAAKKKRIGIISGIAAVVVIVVLTTVVIPNSRYNNAVKLMEEGQYEEAIAAFRAMNGYKDSADQIAECKFLTLKNPQVGDYVLFGSYDQDNNAVNGKEAIEWRVLKVQDDKALLISKYALDCKPYNTSRKEVTWATCTLRTWLNKDFFNTAFSAKEREMIPAVTVSADKNPEYSTNSGNATQDKVFLLSITEANKYFASDSKRQCAPTEYAVTNGAYVNGDNGNCMWWLRSPGYRQDYADLVGSGGHNDAYGYFVNRDDYAIRPALWVGLNH